MKIKFEKEKKTKYKIELVWLTGLIYRGRPGQPPAQTIFKHG